MSRSEPKYRLHKASGRAFISVNGRRRYLGKHGSDQSLALYKVELIKMAVAKHPLFEAELNGRSSARPAGAIISINELLLEYWRFARVYYSPEASIGPGSANSVPEPKAALESRDAPPSQIGKEARKMWDAIELLKSHCGLWPVTRFTPSALEEIREVMIRRGLARTYINQQAARVRRIFKWGARRSIVPATIYHALQAVEGLKRGRCKARETEPVKPVADAWVAATLPNVPPVIRAMIELQRLTGMRSDNLTAMRACDIDRRGKVWIYEPPRHKTAHHGRRLMIPLGARAQAIIEPYLTPNLAACLFRPPVATDDANKKRRAQREATRGAPPKRPKGERYTTASYGRAVARAIVAANRARKLADPNADEIPHWHPHQLRHTLATEVRRRLGLEAASAMLGHARVDVTQLYAETSYSLAERVAMEMG